MVNKQLQQAVLSGVAFHHAAMEAQDRAAVEQLFKERMIPVSCCDLLSCAVLCCAVLCCAMMHCFELWAAVQRI